MDDLEAPLKNRKPPYIFLCNQKTFRWLVSYVFSWKWLAEMIVKREANLEPTHCWVILISSRQISLLHTSTHQTMISVSQNGLECWCRHCWWVPEITASAIVAGTHANISAPWRALTDIHTSSTAQGGGGSFKNRKPIREIGCCETRMAERIHWWTERCLWSPLFHSLSLTICLPTCLSIYLSIHLYIYLSTYQSVQPSIYLSICLSIYLSIYQSISLSLSFICLSV